MTTLTNFKKNLAQVPNHKSISRQFAAASGVLLLLICGVALSSLMSLNWVRHKTKSAMVTSIQLQRLVFELNQALEQSRQYEIEFFRHWQTIGIENAYQQYVEPHNRQIEQVLKIRDQLQTLLTQKDISEGLRQNHPTLLEYAEEVQQYHNNFREAVRLVEDLGSDDIGTLAKTEQTSELLKDTLIIANNPQLMALYNQMIAAEKDYQLRRQATTVEALSQTIIALKAAIETSLDLDASQKATALRLLNTYQIEVQEISVQKQDIHQISDQFHQQTTAMSQKLFGVATEEVEQAQRQIELTSRQAMIILISSITAMFVSGSVIWRSFKAALNQLEIEQEKSERLLLNILPAPIAERLKQEEGTIADSFECVTVLFADIAGFTELSTRVQPTELVCLLNEIFSEFDKLAVMNGLEKIKTIGDAYMVVGGLPQPLIYHAQAIANMALDMKTAISRFNEKHQASLQMRIGINTGPVVAGVIGTKKFIYDLWGDTVNTASRMESHGLIGQIQVTATTYEHLKDQYELEDRGIISVKGKGDMNVYILKGQKRMKLEVSATSISAEN